MLTVELHELLRLIDAYRAPLLAVLAAFLITKLVQYLSSTSKERAVPFKWERPAEADPAWTGQVLENPHIHADGPNQITAYDPAYAYKIATFPSPSAGDMAELVSKAERASHTWRRSTYAQRRQVLRSLLDWTLKNKEAIAQICCRDTGKTMLDAAFGEILTTCEKIRWMLVYGEQTLKPEHRATSWLLAHKVSYVHYEPFGVVGAIVSWNYPFHNLFSPIVAAIMSGNAIVVKTSEQVAWSSFHFANALRSCLEACGHSPDIVQVAIGCEAEAAAAFTRDSRIGHLTFIGSDAVGKEVARNAAEALTPVTLELGGKDPLIVLASADVKFFQDVFLRAVFTGAGQGCIASERLIIHQAKYEEFLSTMSKRVAQLRPGIDVGAMISGNRLAHLDKLVADAVKAGARVLVGGKSHKHPQRPGAHYFHPTLLCDVTEDMAIAREECFAPIMLAMKAKNSDDCIRIANSSRYALGSAVFGRDRADCRYVASRLVCGMVSINDFGTFYLNQGLPFGGTKASGYHRFGGPEGLRSLCNVKAVMEDRFHGLVQTSIPGPLTYPVKEARKSWRFIDGMINLMYAPSLIRRIAGLYGMASAQA